MKICLVTAFPPSRRGLNEYGYHIAKELQRDPLLSLTVLADELDSPQPEVEGFDVVRCWSFDKLSNPLRLLKAIRDVKPDVVWFNLLFSTFGNSPVAAFAGLSIPALMRLSGFYTHVTLHHLMDNIDLGHAGVRYPASYRAAGHLATRVLSDGQLRLGAAAGLSPHLDGEIRRRKCSLSRARYSFRQARDA